MNDIPMALSIIALVLAVFALIFPWLLRTDRAHHPQQQVPTQPLQRPLVLSVDRGAPLHGPYTIPTLGKCEIIKYNPDDYEKPLHCCTCTRELVEDESFYSIDVPDFPDGVLGVCLTCYGAATVAAR